jgi:type I restriction enzyme M protein
VLASIDLHPDTFQPFVSIQTSILVLERKSDEQIRLETASRQFSDYKIFMAVANHIGHDKRGNKSYVRDSKGNEVIEVVEQLVKEWVGDTPTYQRQTTSRKVVDDNTQQIAQGFRAWLSEQD